MLPSKLSELCLSLFGQVAPLFPTLNLLCLHSSWLGHSLLYSKHFRFPLSTRNSEHVLAYPKGSSTIQSQPTFQNYLLKIFHFCPTDLLPISCAIPSWTKASVLPCVDMFLLDASALRPPFDHNWENTAKVFIIASGSSGYSIHFLSYFPFNRHLLMNCEQPIS